jgi:hypothetical protein
LSTPFSLSHFKTPDMNACLVLALTAPVLVALFFATLTRFREPTFGDADADVPPRFRSFSIRPTLSEGARILPPRGVVDGSPSSARCLGVDGSPPCVIAATGDIASTTPCAPSSVKSSTGAREKFRARQRVDSLDDAV